MWLKWLVTMTSTMRSWLELTASFPTIDLSNLVFAIPVYKVSVFLKDEEVTYIKKELSKLTAKKSKQNLRISRGN